MATVLKTKNFINVTEIAADVAHADIFSIPEEVKVRSIEFVPGNANDKIEITNGSATSAVIARLGSGVAAESVIKNFGEQGQYMKIFIDFSDCTLNAGHMLIIELA